MLGDRYLASGLAALARVRDRHWNAGHYGAAVLAAYFFAEEQRLDAAATAALAEQLDRLIARHPELFAARAPGHAPDWGKVAALVEALKRTIGELHAIGHNVIFATLALKAVARRPELATPDNVAGLVELLGQFDAYGPGRPFYGWDDPASVRLEPADAIPVYDSEAAIARTALAAFAEIETVYPFLHQGIVGHLLTHAHALIDLARIGHAGLAAKGHDAHRLYVKLARNPPDAGEPIPREAAIDPFAPGMAAFWQRDHEGGNEWLVGHLFKYIYSFYDLVRHVDDAGERQALETHLAYVLAPTWSIR